VSIQVSVIDRAAFLSIAHDRTAEFLRRIGAPEVFVVKRFYEPAVLLDLRRRAFRWGQDTEASWHPLHDGCPDYHRLHDNYPRAWFRQKLHAFYRHGWYATNRPLFSYFAEVFALKNRLAGYAHPHFLLNKPSDGIVARVNLHHYPSGGGYQAEHVDPTAAHAHIQTLVQASRYGVDFKSGGVFVRASEGDDRIYVDPYTEPGDMIVMSPGIPHGVDHVDPDREYAWRENSGRWIILPLFLMSDYPRPDNTKPRQLGP
jgi:hypothetical protein